MGQGQFQTDAEYAAAQSKFELDDLKSAKFGTGKDFRIWYTGGNARLVCADGDIQFNHATSYDTAEGGETFDPANQEKMLHLNDDAGVECFYNDSLKFETLSDGAKVHGKLEVDGDFKVDDDKKLICGDGDDLQIYHDESHSYIDNTNGTGNIYIKDEIVRVRAATSFAVDNADGTATSLMATLDGAVDLYYDGSKKFETTSGGVECKEDLKLLNDKKIKIGYGDDLQIYHDTAPEIDASMIKNTTETELFIVNAGDESIFIRTNSKNSIRCWDSSEDYKVGLFVNETLALETFDPSGVSGGTWPNANSDNATETGVKIHGDLAITADLHLEDGEKIKLGKHEDLEIYHDGNNSYIKHTGLGNLFIAGHDTCHIYIRAKSGENSIICYDNAGVALFEDEVLRFETVAGGCKVTGDLEVTGTVEPNEIKLVNDKKIKIGYDDDLQLYHETSGDDHSVIKNTEGQLKIVSTDGAVELYHNEDHVLSTATYGIRILGELRMNDSLRIRLGSNEEFGIYFDGTNPRFEGPGSAFIFTHDVWPHYNHTSNDKQDLGDGDYRWDDVYCGDLEEASDGRYKDNIVISDLGLDFINKLTPRSYTKTHGTSGRTHYGLVAQEVEKVITDFGKTTKEFGGIGISEGGMYGLRYTQFLSPLIKAVQELSAEVETLKAEIAALKSS